MKQALNGWQRMWVVVTVVAGLWCLILYPLRHYTTTGNDRYSTSMRADYESGKCQAYIAQPLRDLVEPPYESAGGTCWFIYTTRSINEIDEVPFTLARAQRHEQSESLKRLGEGFIVGLIGFLLISGGLYGSGWVVRWVRRGFAQQT